MSAASACNFISNERVEPDCLKFDIMLFKIREVERLYHILVPISSSPCGFHELRIVEKFVQDVSTFHGSTWRLGNVGSLGSNLESQGRNK